MARKGLGRDAAPRRRSYRRPFHRQSGPGAVPGAIQTDPDAPATKVRLIAYGPGEDELIELEEVDLDRIRELRGRYPVTWLDVDGLGTSRVIERIGEIFRLHPLALEDVVHGHQRAKVEDYGEFLFLVTRMAWFPPDPDVGDGDSAADRPGRQIETEQASLFLGDHFVVTFQERPGSDSFEPVRTRIRLARGTIRKKGPDALAYSLLDAIVDGYFPVIEQLGERLEVLDGDILSHSGSDHLTRLHRLRADLLTLRQILWPQREAVHQLLREPHPLLTEQTHYFLRDVSDHTSQSLDVVESYRELCADLREYHYAQVGARTNEVMKVLTIISSIFVPLTFIAGVYGMNFDTALPGNMPELTWPWAYPVTMGAMLLIALLLLAWFWHKGWLNRDDR